MKNKFNENEFIELCNKISQTQKIKKKIMENWSKIVHIESSMQRKKNQFSLFIGRFQPLHLAHKELFNRVLDEGGNVCIGIRDTETDNKNPFTPLEVMGKIMEEYKELISEGRVKVMICPDICSVEFGRGVGYDIIEHIPPTEISEISATKIRQQMLNGSKI
jgi:cytidyltransferase-like protein